ncbi:nucleotidyl transferase AbiEii/AbiGii toxin family protein [bacterium]|nr:nucleotidyl transferase AbiEii/AbiGii toxin family protein [bacterium]
MKNIADSIRQRLLNISRKENRGFQEFVQYFAMYRFLSRLSSSRYRNRFILKGALLMHVLKLTNIRTTLDIDLLG